MKNFILISLLAITFLFGGETIAVAVKSKGQVTKIAAGTKEESALKLGNAFIDEDMIRTGKNGFAVAMYLDDKTTIKIKENTEFLVGGVRSDAGINKRVSLSYGTMAASVTKQKGSEFLIATPTSVASVKGTEILIISDPVLGDLFITLIGSIEVTNNSTGETVIVDAGETANSTPEGGLVVEETEDEDVPDFEEAEEDASQETHELRFEIEDQDGNIKTIIINYQ